MLINFFMAFPEVHIVPHQYERIIKQAIAGVLC